VLVRFEGETKEEVSGERSWTNRRLSVRLR
jgi:hypothetical protein